MENEPIVFNRYTERTLEGASITFDASNERCVHARLNLNAIRLMDLGDSDFVEFVSIGDEWFICKTKLKRGYKVGHVTGRNGYKINSKSFVKKFISEIKYSEKVMAFELKKTTHEFAAETLYKIYHNKSLK